MKTAILTLTGLALLAACGTNRDDRIRFDGQVYRMKAAKAGDDRSVFTVTISPVSASLEGARAAGGYEGIRYCIANYGTSDIIWAVGPDTPPQNLTFDRDSLTFQGKCDP